MYCLWPLRVFTRKVAITPQHRRFHATVDGSGLNWSGRIVWSRRIKAVEESRVEVEESVWSRMEWTRWVEGQGHARYCLWSSRIRLLREQMAVKKDRPRSRWSLGAGNEKLK